MPIKISIKKIKRSGLPIREGFVTCKIRLADLWDNWVSTDTPLWGITYMTSDGRIGQTIVWETEPWEEEGSEFDAGLYYWLEYQGQEDYVLVAESNSSTWFMPEYQIIYIPYEIWFREDGPGSIPEYLEWIESFCNLANIPGPSLRPVAAKIFLNGSETYTEASISPLDPDDENNTLHAEYEIMFSIWAAEITSQSGLSIEFSDEDGTFEVSGSDIECYINSGTFDAPVLEWVTYSSSIDAWRISGCRSSAGRCDPEKVYALTIASFS